MNIPIIFEDEWLLVVNKPAGLLSVPTPKQESRTLTSILNQDAQVKGLSYRLHPCHRLDRETSGLLIYAKGKSIEDKMIAAFRDRQVGKSILLLYTENCLSRKGRLARQSKAKAL